MNKTLKGLLVAAMPASLGILLGVGVIFWSINNQHTSEHASAPAGTEEKASGATAGGKDMKAFVSTNCAMCHGQDLKGAGGPSLIKAGQTLSEEQLVEILKNGKGGMPGGLAKGQEADVAKYLKTLK